MIGPGYDALKPEHITTGAGSTLGTGSAVMSDAVRVGDLGLLSGRAPIDPATMRVVSDDFTEQAVAVLRDVETVLAAAGATLNQVVRVECFLADAADFKKWNRVWCRAVPAATPGTDDGRDWVRGSGHVGGGRAGRGRWRRWESRRRWRLTGPGCLGGCCVCYLGRASFRWDRRFR